jgi:hypothetical protein
MCQTLMLVADDDLLSDLDQILESKMPTRQGAKQMKVEVTETFGVRRSKDGEIEIHEGHAVTGLCILRAPTLEQAVADLREMMEGDSIGEFEVHVIDVHPTNDKDLLS